MRGFAELLSIKRAGLLQEIALADGRASREENTSQTPLTAHQQPEIIAAFATEFVRRCRLRGFDTALFAETFIVAVTLFVEGILAPHQQARLADRLRELADMTDPRPRKRAHSQDQVAIDCP